MKTLLILIALSINPTSAIAAKDVLILKAGSFQSASCRDGYNPPSSQSKQAQHEAEKQCHGMNGEIKETKCETTFSSDSNWIGSTRATAVACLVICSVDE